MSLDNKQDPELVEDETPDNFEDEDKYDGQAVASVDYDPTQFELPDDYEFEGDVDA